MLSIFLKGNSTIRWIKNKPLLYFTILKIIGRGKKLRCNKQTDIIIEGFPRSANSFFVYALYTSCELSGYITPRIAHHLHSVAQLKYGLTHNIPIIILIRKPDDAIASLIMRKEGYAIKSAIKDYVNFYRYVREIEDKVIIAPFEEVIREYGNFIEKLNREYNYNLPYYKNEEIKNVVFSKIKSNDIKSFGNDLTRYAMPSNRKDKDKQKLKRMINEKSMIKEAYEIYNVLISKVYKSY